MNISSIIQLKAVEAIRGLVRMADGGSSKRAPATYPQSPVMATRFASDGIPVLSSAALAMRHAGRPAPACAPQRQNLRPLRVLQVVEKGQPRSGAGRMVISGSMADVCAELDRLVAREAALH